MDSQKSPTVIQIEKVSETLKETPADNQDQSFVIQEIQKAAEERAKKRPVIQKILNRINGKPSDFTEIVINSEPLEKRVAMLHNGILEKFEVERTGDQRMVGTIFRGKIQNLEPGLKAAFVDIGEAKNAFLHYWDILPAAQDSSIEIVRDNESEQMRKQKEKITIKDIPSKYPIGTDIIVQITKASIGTKGPRTTTNIAIPGRFLVLMPFSGQCGISRKIMDKGERTRLKKILRELTIPEGMGVIMRTAGEGKKSRYFVRDLHILLRIWEAIQKKIEESKEPCMLYQEPDLIERTVRDFLTEDIDRVLVDDEATYTTMLDVVSAISPRSKSKFVHFKENIPIFERFNIEKQIAQTFMTRVALPSGGEIVIEETEALVAIDVNTGSHKGTNRDGTGFIVQANLEAASEISRQIQLRNIGGLIIIDFIDMKQRKDRNAVYMRMKHEMRHDKAKTHVLPISQLGILQMSRQRHKESNSSGIYTNCPYCNGKGIVKSERTMSVEIQRRLHSVIRNLRPSAAGAQPRHLIVLLHSAVLQRLRDEDENILSEIEQKHGIKLTFRADPAFHIENFCILDGATGEELR